MGPKCKAMDSTQSGCIGSFVYMEVIMFLLNLWYRYVWI
jgi:hypothetical protein